VKLQIAVVAAGVLTLSACGRAEQPILEQFFGASRLRDTTALQSIATTIFEPRQQGIVRTFQITAVTPERASGQKVSEDVTVDAPVILPDGQTVQKTLLVTLERREGKDGDQSSRWIVTAVRDAAVSRPPPPS
jgi:hypothetical protein